MKAIRSAPRLKQFLSEARRRNKRLTVGFVPTMGALHEGHASLIRRARKENSLVVVSIFVNPLQFGPKEDFARYPRPVSKDLALCRRNGADIVFLPEARSFLKEKSLQKKTRLPELANKLCGPFRPGHFQGVADIVKLFHGIVRPDRAYYGLKDYQQCRVIEETTRAAFGKTIRVILCPTVREKDGLAMSSRNRYLSRQERKDALRLIEALRLGRRLALQGRLGHPEIEQRMRGIVLRIPGVRIDYLSIVHAKSLRKMVESTLSNTAPLLVAGAIRIGGTRLIDNLLAAKRRKARRL